MSVCGVFSGNLAEAQGKEVERVIITAVLSAIPASLVARGFDSNMEKRCVLNSKYYFNSIIITATQYLTTLPSDKNKKEYAFSFYKETQMQHIIHHIDVIIFQRNV